MEYFDVYNKYGEKTSEIVERTTAHKQGICHRVVHLWILNEKNQVLLQQRSACKDAGANLWYVSVGGHIEASESIAHTLIRETKEELGLDIRAMAGSIDYLYSFRETLYDHNNTYIDDEFFDVFLLKADFQLDELTLQEEEVQAVEYVDYERFKKMIQTKDESLWHHKIGYQLLLIALDSKLGM